MAQTNKTAPKKTKKEQVIDPKQNPNDLVNVIIDKLKEKGAREITLINIADKTTIADYFVICDAKSTTAVKALCEQIDERLSKDFAFEPLRIEGKADARWIAMDYGSVIVHIFHEETRRFYQLERLWTDGASFTTISEEEQ